MIGKVIEFRLWDTGTKTFVTYKGEVLDKVLIPSLVLFEGRINHGKDNAAYHYIVILNEKGDIGYAPCNSITKVFPT